MYSMNGLGATTSTFDEVRAAIRRARGAGYGGWDYHETMNLQRLLNSKMSGASIAVTGQYGPALCVGVDQIFGGTPQSTQLKIEIGSACSIVINPEDYLIRTETKNYTSPAESGGLIVDDEATPTTVSVDTGREVSKPLSDYCNAPPGLCAETQQLANSIRTAASSACDYLLQYEKRPPQIKGLGGVNCQPPGTNRISQKNVTFFMQNYSPCQLKNIGVCPPPPKTPFKACRLGSGACVDSRSPDILDTAVTQCQYNVTPRGDDSACPSPNGVVTHANAHRFSPCELAKLSSCGELDMDLVVPFGPQQVTEDDEAEEDNNTKYMVGGLLALLAIGGVAYAATRKKRKRK